MTTISEGLDSGISTLVNIMAYIRRATGNPSLGQYAKKSVINSRAFIDQSLTQLPVMNHVLRVTQGIIAAYVMSTFQMRQFVSKTRTVSDLMQVVSTESLTQIDDLVSMAALAAGVEALTPKPTTTKLRTPEEINAGVMNKINAEVAEAAARLKNPSLKNLEIASEVAGRNSRLTNSDLQELEKNEKIIKKIAEAQIEAAVDAAIGNSVTDQAQKKAIRDRIVKHNAGVATDQLTKDEMVLAEKAKAEVIDRLNKDPEYQALMQAAKDAALAAKVSLGTAPRYDTKAIELDLTGALPLGKLLEITLKNPDNGASVAFKMLVHLWPYVVSTNIMPAFINIGHHESFFRRVLKWRAGELTFMRDLVFQADRITRNANALRSDKDGAIVEFLNAQAKGDKQAYQRLLYMAAGRVNSENVASSVMIFSQESLQRAKSQEGVDLHNAADRDRWFKTTMSWILVVVDPTFERITLYIDGVSGGGDFSFSQFEVKAKNSSETDITKLIAMLAQNKMPRF